MKLIKGVRVVLPEPGHPHSTQVFMLIESQGEPTEEVELTAAALVQFPIDIHIDEKGSIVTLRMRANEVEVHGLTSLILDSADSDKSGVTGLVERRSG